jgi:hypothetical protein
MIKNEISLNAKKKWNLLDEQRDYFFKDLKEKLKLAGNDLIWQPDSWHTKVKSFILKKRMY